MADDKHRIIQELVPGRQVTLAHIIASPGRELVARLNFDATEAEGVQAIGVLTVSPGETAIIMADIAMKAANVDVGYIDYSAGSLIITGSVSSVEASAVAILDYVRDVLGYETVTITRT
ncbi:MAG: BMC domain-containing protein [Butyrivibrio sp.]|nr:BMC domain-containing protein [Butyrivibrio sp.]